MTNQNVLRFEIAPKPGEGARSCSAIVASALSKTRSLWFAGALGAGIGLMALVLPVTRDSMMFLGLAAVYASLKGTQALGRANLRQLQDNDPHARETYFVEIGPEEVYTGCAHVHARYPWQEFVKVIEDAEFYLFVRASGGGVAIPKRILDAAKEAELCARIREWSPDQGVGLASDRKARRNISTGDVASS